MSETQLLRSKNQIIEAEQKFFDLVWYDRHQTHIENAQQSNGGGDDVAFTLGKEAAKRIEAQYPEGSLGPYTDFEWGMLNGKLSALRWVLGAEWDELDT